MLSRKKKLDTNKSLMNYDKKNTLALSSRRNAHTGLSIPLNIPAITAAPSVPSANFFISLDVNCKKRIKPLNNLKKSEKKSSVKMYVNPLAPISGRTFRGIRFLNASIRRIPIGSYRFSTYFPL